MFILSSLLFAIATFRAGILPRWAAGLLALGSLMVPVGGLLPTEIRGKNHHGPDRIGPGMDGIRAPHRTPGEIRGSDP